MEYRVLNEHGKIIYVIDRGIIIRNDEGKPIRMVGAMTDITHRKEYEVILTAVEKLNSKFIKTKSHLQDLKQYQTSYKYYLEEYGREHDKRAASYQKKFKWRL